MSWLPPKMYIKSWLSLGKKMWSDLDVERMWLSQNGTGGARNLLFMFRIWASFRSSGSVQQSTQFKILGAWSAIFLPFTSMKMVRYLAGRICFSFYLLAFSLTLFWWLLPLLQFHSPVRSKLLCGYYQEIVFERCKQHLCLATPYIPILIDTSCLSTSNNSINLFVRSWMV